ncbi:Predicted E3 ubiquitin ligase [Ceraceosorus bombacis]|uniref:Predicted E3 ubiquitin ligase n=1 Tax=Ceraceosorus bombacis TaxID=401625 RepID=A0A0P1BQ37_9BASI|nr:Predicted E3 ubiquitin ligase [Ceraceosorus bombacis]
MSTPRGGAGGNGAHPGKNVSGGQHTHGGRKGQNIDHLLGFTMPPRARPPPPVAAKKRRGGHFAPFNKERYVNAQYRFLLKPTGDYTAFYADPDVFLHWPDILSVLIPTSSALSNSAAPSSATNAHAPHLETHEGASCPICLSPPTAPRMTKCGHVFCYPCILHYLSTPDGESTATASGSYSSSPSRPGAAPHRPPGSAPASRAASYSTQTSMQSTKPPPKWKRCPICWDAVYARDVKAVEFWDTRAEALEADETAGCAPGPLDGLLMRLIERPHLTTLALPISATWPGSSEPLIAQRAAPWHFLPDVRRFSKLMISTPEHVEGHLRRDASELAAERRLLESLGGSSEPSLQFVDLALAKVHEQMDRARRELDLPHIRKAIEKALADLADVQEMESARMLGEASKWKDRQPSRVKPQPVLDDVETPAQAPDAQPKGGEGAAEPSEGAAEWLALQSHVPAGGATTVIGLEVDSYGTTTSPTSTKSAAPRTRRNINPPAPSSSSYLFYQAATGQHIYLQPLDVKVLLAEYGSYAAFPRQLKLKIQGADEGSMNDELRRRCKYLSHLPMGTDVVFSEVDWDFMASQGMQQQASREGNVAGAEATSSRSAHQPIVSRSTLKPFEQGMKIRRNRRRDRERKDDRARTRAEEAEAASRPGGANFAARRQAAIDSIAHDPELAAAAAAGFEGHDYDDSGIDWDWLDLEEDYIVGGRNAPQMRGSKGLNRQPKGGNASPATPRNGSSGARTPAAETPGRPFVQADNNAERLPTSVGRQGQPLDSSQGQDSEILPTPSTRRAKAKKKKLVLTAGGRGAA